jgi:hypothetical protein
MLSPSFLSTSRVRIGRRREWISMVTNEAREHGAPCERLAAANACLQRVGPEPCGRLREKLNATRPDLINSPVVPPRADGDGEVVGSTPATREARWLVTTPGASESVRLRRSPWTMMPHRHA